jgi:hypothetical protein
MSKASATVPHRNSSKVTCGSAGTKTSTRLVYLHPLTKWTLQLPAADEAAGEGEESISSGRRRRRTRATTRTSCSSALTTTARPGRLRLVLAVAATRSQGTVLNIGRSEGSLLSFWARRSAYLGPALRPFSVRGVTRFGPRLRGLDATMSSEHGLPTEPTGRLRISDSHATSPKGDAHGRPGARTPKAHVT